MVAVAADHDQGQVPNRGRSQGHIRDQVPVPGHGRGGRDEPSQVSRRDRKCRAQLQHQR